MTKFEMVVDELTKSCELVAVETEEQWHEERQKAIGGSEIGAILGYNNYTSPYAVYAQKLGIGERFKGNIATEVGTVLEPYIRKKFPGLVQLKDQVEAIVYEIPYILKSKEYTFASANLDGVVEIDGEYSVLEIKTASEMSGDKWEGEEIPDSYYFQVQWYLAVTGWKQAYICYLIGNRKMDYKVIPRNDDVINSMMSYANDFWNNHILAKQPPEFSWNDTDAIKELYPKQNEGEVIELDGEEEKTVVQKWRELEDKKKEIEREIEECKNIIKGSMGTAETARIGIDKITWKLQKKDGFYVKPSESRVLRYSAGKIK